MRTIARLLLPARIRQRLRSLWLLKQRPPVGSLRFGSFRRLSPISREFGEDRGQPIDRYYIENFLARRAEDIRGRVLEIKDDSYTRQYGGSRVTRSDVLDVSEDNLRATIVAGLTGIS